MSNTIYLVEDEGDFIKHVRHRIVNQTLVIMTFLALPALLTSIYRVRDVGWQLFMTLQIALYVVILLTTIFRHKLSFTSRAVVLFGELLALAIIAIYSLGLMANITFLIVLTVFASVLYGNKGGIISILCVALVLTVFTFLITQGVITFNIDFNVYYSLPSAWISRIFSIVVFCGMLLIAISQLNNALFSRVEKLEDYRDHLEQLVHQRTEELESFSYSISHDLRAPLRAISGFSSLALDEEDESIGEETISYLHRIDESARKMDSMIKGLLTLSRISREDINLNQVNLSELAKDIIDDLPPRISGQDLTFNIAENITVHGDERLLRILLLNLINNAWKFTRECDRAVIEISSKTEDGQQIIYVKDNGTGFDDAYAENLFTPFQRLHTESEYEGYGIGLATCKKIVQRHGGDIWAEAKPDEGATFFFTLD